MKSSIASLIFILLFTKCSNTDDGIKPDVLNGVWQVENISGGFAGINDDYETGTITWTFTTATSKLQVVNNNGLAGIIYDGLPTEEYGYSILEVEKELFLHINGQEFAGITLLNGQLILDQNKTTSGTGADGFVLRFKQ